MDAGTFDKNEQSEEYQNISVTVVEEGETIDALLLDGEEVAKNGGTDWSVSSGTTIVLKKEYLASFDVGSVVFVAETSAGEVPFEVTITESEA